MLRGATPPAHALIAEYFPPDERGKAYGIHTTSSTAGALIAATAGGWIAAAYGWRSAFLGVALLSAPVCVLAQLVLKEPRRGSSTPFKTGTFIINCRALFGKRSFVYIVVSLIAYSMLPYGVLLFMPTYLVRDMHVGLGLAGSIYGGAATLGTIIGTLSGGAISDRIARRSQRTLLQLSAAGTIVTLPLTLWALSVASLVWFFVLLAALVATLYAALPPTLAIVQAICGSQRRALAVAVVFVGLNSVGMTIAPLLTGIISDWLAPVWRTESLRLSMEFVSLALAPAAGLLLLASRHLSTDFEA